MKHFQIESYIRFIYKLTFNGILNCLQEIVVEMYVMLRSNIIYIGDNSLTLTNKDLFTGLQIRSK